MIQRVWIRPCCDDGITRARAHDRRCTPGSRPDGRAGAVLWGFAAFCFLVAVLAEPAGGVVAFTTTTTTTTAAGALVVQLLVRRVPIAGAGKRAGASTRVVPTLPTR